MNRDMARKVHRLLRWDPLGRWYQHPPPLMRPLAMMKAEWQAVPLMPTVPLDLKHRYIPVIPGGISFWVTQNGSWKRMEKDEGS